jgi:hypothetical protein
MRRNLFPDFRLASSQLIEIPRPVCQVFRSAFCRFRCALFVQQPGSLFRTHLSRGQKIAYLERSDQQLAFVLFRQAPNPCGQLSATRSGSERF